MARTTRGSNAPDYSTLDPVEGDDQPTDYLRFNSVSAFKRYLSGHVYDHPRAKYMVHDPDYGWCGRPWSEALDALSVGDKQYADKARAYYDKLSDLLDWTASKFARVDHFNGPVLNLSAYLAGAPRMTKRRVRVDDIQAPLHIVVAVNSAGCCSQSDLIERGCAILALVQALSATRPVTLWLSAIGRGGYSNAAIFVKVDTSPLSLAHAGYYLADQAVGRRMFFSGRQALTKAGWSSSYPPVGRLGDAKTVGKLITQAALGIKDEDLLYVPRPDGPDFEGTSADAWLRDNVAKYGRSVTD